MARFFTIDSASRLFYVLILYLMNTRHPFRCLLVMAGLLYCQITALAQTSARLASALPTQTFYNATSASFKIEAASVPVLKPSLIPADGIIPVTEVAFSYYCVFDTAGELWIGGPVAASRTIDLGHLPTGVYHLYLSDKDGEVVRKVLKKG